MSVLGKLVYISKSNFGRSALLCSANGKRTYFTYTRELTQPLNRMPDTLTAECALQACLKSDQTVFIHGAVATPMELINAMTTVGKSNCLKNIKIYHMHTEKEAPYLAEDCKGIFFAIALFMAANMRKAVAEGRADTVPIFLQDIPQLFYRKILKPNIVLCQVSPPDCHGYVSLGTSVDTMRAAIMNAETTVALVNKQMPRTFGDGIIHISHLDYLVDADRPLPVHGSKGEIGEEEKTIGKLIGENLVCDGATLQMGIGTIPDAVLAQLKEHKDLGIHSEMFSIGVVDLVKRGCVTNNLKKFHQGKIVAGFCMGDQKLYDFIDDNPFLEFKTIDYVNNTHVISQQPNMTAINSCIEVDLTGQVCSDSIGTRMYSGFGGQVDFIRGAAEGLDGNGKPIIALSSVTKKGVSKIAPTLKVGAGVVSSRAHVHYIVTEHGIAELFGKSLRQRAHALINIAHPKHREALEKAAFERLKAMPAP